MAAPPKTVLSEEKNPRGIPKAPFIANVEEYLGGPNGDVESTLRAFQDAIAKYRYMDSSLTGRRASLEEKIPDIKKTLDMVEFIRDRKAGSPEGEDEDDDLDDDDSASQPLRTTFELNDTLYAEAELEDTGSVYLWLGANVMLSYSIPDAVSLLQGKLDSAHQSLSNTIEDLEFLREQLTIMEVNTARVYNWDVKRRREQRESEAQEKVDR
ncbi:prefoldin subunit [Coprinopsis marcescibilis]|uniref:Prefoldin subunit 3 n=1 Tax=Coprinopsis marcescibilis TaxID=230819 RepID=A0A5C3L284_COPMA|nr:prefoldin subunit [Coprinopsis marcescibilis]